MPGAGASSSTFWWRRCTEQSRSKRWTQLPCVSAKIWISMWRERLRYFSISTLIGAEGRDRLALARGQRGGEILAFLDQTHALAAAAGRGLDQHRIADRVGLLAAGPGAWSSPW
jgi:hypothetical protein